MHFTPAAWVVRAFGSNRAVARAAGCRPCTVIRWKKRSNGEVHGAIPPDQSARLLIVAEQRGLDVTARDLILGRELPDQPAPAVTPPRRPELPAPATPVPARAPARSPGR